MRELNPIQNVLYKIWYRLHLDLPLFFGLILLIIAGLFILYSASGQNFITITQQISKLLGALVVMLIFSWIPPHRYKAWAPWIFLVTIILLLIVLPIGMITKGVQRWLNFGLFKFQPAEAIKLTLPMMLSWYLSEKPSPIAFKYLLICSVLVFLPVVVTALQPDLGTALMIAATGIFVILLAGINWKIITGFFLGAVLAVPVIWNFFMHAYQKNRVLTFINPERDPLGDGYHIIQSKIAIGSGGFLGKGWLVGTQSHLQFLPAHTTDFIFAVCGEELGFIGCLLLFGAFFYIVGRCLYISIKANDSFSRLLAGSLTLTFFFSFFINVGMVLGILPVVGIPLPLVSYGGSSIITIMAAFGIIMSIQTHKKLL